MDRSCVAIVIPAFNEAETIGEVVTTAMPLGLPIVVDDGSTDMTRAEAEKAGAIVVCHSANAGYDAALNSGFAKAAELSFLYVVTTDADGQHDPTDLSRVIEHLERGADLVAGVRDRKQRISEYLFAWFGRWRWGIHDPLCGLKGYRMAVYCELGHFDAYQSIGTELAIFAAQRRKRLEQILVVTRERRDTPRFGRRLNGNIKILRAMWIALLESCG